MIFCLKQFSSCNQVSSSIGCSVGWLVCPQKSPTLWQPQFSPWEDEIWYFVCVCACVRACAHLCECSFMTIGRKGAWQCEWNIVKKAHNFQIDSSVFPDHSFGGAAWHSQTAQDCDQKGHIFGSVCVQFLPCLLCICMIITVLVTQEEH